MVTLGQKILPPLGLLAVAAITIALLVGTRPDTQAELQPLSPARVLTTEVRTMDIRPVTRITGKLQPARKATLRLEVSGNIIARHVEPGQRVEEDEVLLRVDDGDYRDAVAEARALYQQEQDAIRRDRELLRLGGEEEEILERELERMQKLGRESLASKSSYDASLRSLLQHREQLAELRHSVDSAEARLQTRRAVLNLAERNLQRTRLVAPFAATVNSAAVDVGDYISAGQVALELVQLDTLDLYLETTGATANQLRLGQEVTVEVDARQFPGNVFALAADPDPVTNTHALRIRLTGEGLYPGQLAVVELPGKQLNNVEVVPMSSILQDEGRAYVFTVEGNHLAQRPVNLLTRLGDMQAISGVAAGTRIVMRDVAVLADGQEVHVE